MGKGICTVEDCEKEVLARGLCRNHYMRLRRQGDPNITKRARYGTVGCSVVGCDRPHKAHGLCGTHLYRLRANGDVGVAQAYRTLGGKNLSKAQRARLGKYGMGPAAMIVAIEAQGHQCTLCGKHITVNTCHVDHDHETGKVRSLLCAGCNVGLGRFDDYPARLRAAAAYIEAHRT